MIFGLFLPSLPISRSGIELWTIRCMKLTLIQSNALSALEAAEIPGDMTGKKYSEAVFSMIVFFQFFHVMLQKSLMSYPCMELPMT